jgi:hypothetical protein
MYGGRDHLLHGRLLLLPQRARKLHRRLGLRGTHGGKHHFQHGRLPQLRLQEGDTIVVGRQRAVVGADGAVRNNYLFEVPGRIMTGRELIEYARPLPSATNAVIRGTRNGHPFSRYASLAELAGLPLGDQDQVTFITDAPARTVRVTVEGSRIGPSVLVIDYINSKVTTRLEGHLGTVTDAVFCGESCECAPASFCQSHVSTIITQTSFFLTNV